MNNRIWIMILAQNKAVSVGKNLIQNGTFDSAEHWFLSDGWSIADGKLSGTVGAYAPATPDTLIEVAKTYRLTFTVTVVSGSVQWYCGGAGEIHSTSGTYSEDLTAGDTDFNLQAASEGFTGTIDNVTAYEI